MRGVAFSLAAASFVAILGPSGCGKTSILRMIGGFEEVTAGAIEIDGRSIQDIPANRRPVNTVFQNYALFPHLSVFDNVAFGPRLGRLSEREVRSAAIAALETVRMGGLADRWPHQLSGGQQQRVAVARAFVNRPRLLLLDEPLGALDLKMRRHMQVELKDIQRRLGMTFLYVTHDQEEAFALSDRVIVMNAGRIEQAGPPADIYDRPVNAFVADFIAGANLIGGRLQGSRAIATPLGTVKGEPAPGLAAGDQASLCFRPEAVRLGAAAEGCPFKIEATVTHIVFQGADRRIEARAGEVTIAARTPVANHIAPGQRIAMGVPAEALRIVAGTREAITA